MAERWLRGAVVLGDRETSRWIPVGVVLLRHGTGGLSDRKVRQGVTLAGPSDPATRAAIGKTSGTDFASASNNFHIAIG